MIKYSRRFLDDRARWRRWLDPRIQLVQIPDLERYLLHKGWKPVPPDRPRTLVFQEPASDAEGPLYQFLPTEEWDGFRAQVWELLAALAEIEDRHAGDVLSDILRLAGHELPNGSPAEPSCSANVGGK